MTTKIKFLMGFLAIIAVGLVTRISFVFYHSSGYHQTANLSQSIAGAETDKSSAEKILEQDYDGDGLPDREEIIYGTNPLKPDTDGDGYLDGEEIVTGHDPLDRSSNDKSGTVKTVNGATVSANFTDRVSDLALASVVNDNGLYDFKSTNTDVFNNAVTTAQKEMATYFHVPLLTDTDIKISADNSNQAVETYVQTISPIVEKSILSSNQSITTAFQTAGNLNPSDYAGYKKAYQALRLVEVPSSWKELHKKSLTLLLSLSVAFDALSSTDIDNDPLKAVAALTQLQSLTAQIPNLLNQISSLMKAQNITDGDIILKALGA